MATTVRISLNKKLIEILDILHAEYPALDDAEIFKLALSNLIHSKTNTQKQLKNSGLQSFLDDYQNTKIQVSKASKTYTNFKDYQKKNYKYE